MKLSVLHPDYNEIEFRINFFRFVPDIEDIPVFADLASKAEIETDFSASK